MTKIILGCILLCILTGCTYNKFATYKDGVLHKDNVYYMNKDNNSKKE